MRIRKTGKIKQAVLLMTLAAVLLSMPFAAAQAARRQKVRSVKINSTNFPDKDFRAYVSRSFDRDGDGILSVKELDRVTAIDLKKDFQGKSLKGIGLFTELESFSIYADYWEPGEKKSMSFYVEEVDLTGNQKLK